MYKPGYVYIDYLSNSDFIYLGEDKENRCKHIVLEVNESEISAWSDNIKTIINSDDKFGTIDEYLKEYPHNIENILSAEIENILSAEIVYDYHTDLRKQFIDKHITSLIRRFKLKRIVNG